MKRTIFFILFLASVSLFAQAEMISYCYSFTKKITVGSSPDEVKKILGKPFAVQGGFPDYESIIINGMPDHIGQLNSTTWYYKFKPKTFSSVLDECCINGFDVDKDLFQSYYDSTKVYFYKGKIISSLLAQGYLLYKDQNLSSQPISKVGSFFIPRNKKVKYTPIACVIFDKGTQVVADIRNYLLFSE